MMARALDASALSAFDEKPDLREEASVESIPRPRDEEEEDYDGEKGRSGMVGNGTGAEEVRGGNGVAGGLQKVVSAKSVRDVASIPNGGLMAWLQVLGAFVLFFNTWYVF